jgi:hypothetical protein
LREISPALTSWIYEGSEALRSTGVALSAVPVAASEAEKTIYETLTQPASSLMRPQPQAREVEAKKVSRLPTMLALAGAGSLITQRLQNELAVLTRVAPPTRAETTTSGELGWAASRIVPAKAYQPFAELYEDQIAEAEGRAAFEAVTSEANIKAARAARIAGSAAAVLELARGMLAGASVREAATEASKAAAMASAVATVGELVVSLQSATTAKAVAETSAQAIATTQVSRIALAGQMLATGVAQAISELSAETSAEAAGLSSGRIAAGEARELALTQPHHVQPYIPIEPSVPPAAPKLSPLVPEIKGAVSLAMEEKAVEDEEEDLRDLERKITRIISDQLSRYYGCSRIQ